MYGARDERPPGPGVPIDVGPLLLHNLISRVFASPAPLKMVDRFAVDEPMPQPVRLLVTRTALIPNIVTPSVGIGR